MQENDLYYSELFDVYGALFSENQRVIAGQYFRCDLSFGEIAENVGTSRQAVFDTVKKIKNKLDETEAELALFRRLSQVKEAAAAIREGSPEKASALLSAVLEKK